MKNETNIFSSSDQFITQKEKEKKLQQKAMALWFTGYSGAGKTIIAIELEKILFQHGYFVQILDGDYLRAGVNNNLGFSMEDRQENIRRAAEISKLFLQSGIITINSFISPTPELRALAKQIIGENNFKEIFINTPLEVCVSRDVKGLYKKAKEGGITDFTGIQQSYTPPINPDLEILTESKSALQCALEIYNFILPKIKSS